MIVDNTLVLQRQPGDYRHCGFDQRHRPGRRRHPVTALPRPCPAISARRAKSRSRVGHRGVQQPDLAQDFSSRATTRSGSLRQQRGAERTYALAELTLGARLPFPAEIPEGPRALHPPQLHRHRHRPDHRQDLRRHRRRPPDQPVRSMKWLITTPSPARSTKRPASGSPLANRSTRPTRRSIARVPRRIERSPAASPFPTMRMGRHSGRGRRDRSRERPGRRLDGEAAKGKAAREAAVARGGQQPLKDDPDLTQLSKPALEALATEAGVTSVKGLSKDDLIAAINAERDNTR
jgi:hypothetical protein